MRIQAVLAVMAMLGCAPTLADDMPSPQPQQVVPGITLIPGGFLPNRQPDGNTIIFDAPQGLIVMDTGRHKWHRQAILDFAKAQGKPVAAIINSHWHLDHVSGNPDIRAAYPGLKVYASNAIDGALTGFLARSAAGAKEQLNSAGLAPETAEDIRNDVATFENGAALKPDVVIDKSALHTIAGRTLQVNLAPNAATDGDVWVYDPVTRIAAVGDLVTFPAPFLDTACPAGWSAALRRIAATPFKTLIPGHGAAMTPMQFATYRTAFDAMIRCSASTRSETECAAGWTAAVQVLLGTDPAGPRRVTAYAAYYVKDVLRAHGGKSAECRA